jgi:anti-sigma factor RsiW
MTKMYTPNDLVRYIYGETSQAENEIIEILLQTDTKFKKLYSQLTSSKHDLDDLIESPSDEVIWKILNNAQSLDMHSV